MKRNYNTEGNHFNVRSRVPAGKRLALDQLKYITGPFFANTSYFLKMI